MALGSCPQRCSGSSCAGGRKVLRSDGSAQVQGAGGARGRGPRAGPLTPSHLGCPGLFSPAWPPGRSVRGTRVLGSLVPSALGVLFRWRCRATGEQTDLLPPTCLCGSCCGDSRTSKEKQTPAWTTVDTLHSPPAAVEHWASPPPVPAAFPAQEAWPFPGTREGREEGWPCRETHMTKSLAWTSERGLCTTARGHSSVGTSEDLGQWGLGLGAQWVPSATEPPLPSPAHVLRLWALGFLLGKAEPAAP